MGETDCRNMCVGVNKTQYTRSAHPASCTVGTGSFPGVKNGRGVTLTPHPLLVPWSWTSRAIPLLPLWAVRPVQSLSACTRVHFTLPVCRIFMKCGIGVLYKQLSRKVWVLWTSYVTVILTGTNGFRFALSDVADSLCDVMLCVFELGDNRLREGRTFRVLIDLSTHVPWNRMTFWK